VAQLPVGVNRGHLLRKKLLPSILPLLSRKKNQGRIFFFYSQVI
jgi:hypothetical protein